MLSSAYTKTRTFQPPLLCQQGCAREAGRGHSQDSWPKLTKGIFHTIWCRTQYKNGGVGQGVVIAAQGQAGHRSAGGEHLQCASLVLYILLLLFSPPLLSF